MKKQLLMLMLVALTKGPLMNVASAQPSIPATLIDLNGNNPISGSDDVSQLLLGGVSSPAGLNYYFNNGWGAVSPGQIFTTGNNPAGYSLNSVAVFIPGDAGGLPGAGQPYYLRIYSVSDTNATLLATYESQPDFTFYVGDWLQFTNLTGVALKPNAQYAYSFANQIVFGAGYGNLGNLDGNVYSGGQACLLPALGGPISYGTASSFDASFNVGLMPATSLTVNPPAFTPVPPGNIITNGEAVTITADAFGPGPIGYQWQTDGGGGGALTNIPRATAATLSPDTATWPAGAYQYAVVVTNSSGVVTSAVAGLTVTQPTMVVPLSDMGPSLVVGAFDIRQATGGGNGDGLNYYNNMGASSGFNAGQTFTTGANAQGYTLNTLAIRTGDGGYNGDNSAFGTNAYDLYIYKVKGTQATVLAHYFTLGATNAWQDWMQWSNLSLTLNSNTTYAYSFAINYTNGNPYEALATSPNSTDLYPNGNLVLISPQGGTMVYGSSGKADAVFNVGLSLNGGLPAYPITSPIVVSPSAIISKGTSFTLSETATGDPVLHYTWLTDGGSGGAVTNITPNDASNLVVNTTANWQPGVYQYAVVVTNASGSATSAVTAVTMTFANGTATLTDLGAAPTPGDMDISQLSGGYEEIPGLNYYWNSTPPVGQSFTTGNNPGGYTLTSLALLLGGNGPDWLGNDGPENFVLRLYAVNGSTATLYATYASQLLITSATQYDWVQWSDLAVPLAPDTTYAYTFYSDYGWCNLANAGGEFYPGGEACSIPATGGAITYSSTTNFFDAAFNIGLAGPSISLSISGNPDGQLQLQWNAGILLQAPNVQGPWTTNSANSPYLVAPTAPQMFYRVQAP